jgi:signal recognition particle subunit SEC65
MVRDDFLVCQIIQNGDTRTLAVKIPYTDSQTAEKIGIGLNPLLANILIQAARKLLDEIPKNVQIVPVKNSPLYTGLKAARLIRSAAAGDTDAKIQLSFALQNPRANRVLKAIKPMALYGVYAGAREHREDVKYPREHRTDGVSGFLTTDPKQESFLSLTPNRNPLRIAISPNSISNIFRLAYLRGIRSTI